MAPHAKHLDSTFVFDDLIDEPVLNIDPARVCPAHISDEFLNQRRPPKGIIGENAKKFRLRSETSRSQTNARSRASEQVRKPFDAPGHQEKFGPFWP